MQFKELGNLFNFDGSHGIYEMFAGTFKRYSSLSDMQNIHKDLLNKEFKINADGISEFTAANIQAKASTMGLADSLTAELVAMGKDATFTQKAATGKLTFGEALEKNAGSFEEISDAILRSDILQDDVLDDLKDSINMGGDVLEHDVTKIINNNKNLADSFIDLGTTATTSTGFFNGLKTTFTGIVATLKPMLPLIATIGAAVAAYKGFKFLDDKFTLTFGTAQKHLEDSSSAYAATVSELENLNSQTDQYKSTLESIGKHYGQGHKRQTMKWGC